MVRRMVAGVGRRSAVEKCRGLILRARRIGQQVGHLVEGHDLDAVRRL